MISWFDRQMDRWSLVSKGVDAVAAAVLPKQEVLAGSCPPYLTCQCACDSNDNTTCGQGYFPLWYCNNVGGNCACCFHYGNPYCCATSCG
jgi:hypothetical protein